MPSPLPTYECAYRDPLSPLTPIPSLHTSETFNFNSILLHSVDGKHKTPRTLPRTPFNTPTKQFEDNSLNAICKSHSIKVPVTPLSSICELKIQNFKSTPIINNKSLIDETIKPSPHVMETIKEKKLLREVYKFHHRNRTNLKKIKYDPKILLKHNIATPTSNLDTTGGLKRIFKKASPVRLKPLCPRARKFLKSINMEKYFKLFEKEEIDFSILADLTVNDLVGIGVNKIDSKKILNSYIFFLL